LQASAALEKFNNSAAAIKYFSLIKSIYLFPKINHNL
jgi:hypothetical protein